MISIIVAIAKDRVIGGNNELLWHISEDLKNFKSLTLGHPIIMGRKTYESIGRPLPGRRNIVISRNENYKADGCEVVSSIEAALDLCDSSEENFIIGGGAIYKKCLPLADRLYVTKVEKDYIGDTFFPEIDLSVWKEYQRVDYNRGEVFEHPFSFIVYCKNI